MGHSLRALLDALPHNTSGTMTKIEKMAVEAFPTWDTNPNELQKYLAFMKGASSLMTAALTDIVNYHNSILGDAQPAPIRRLECEEIVKMIVEYGQEQE